MAPNRLHYLWATLLFLLVVLLVVASDICAAQQGLGRIADLNTPIPNGSGSFTGFQYPALSGGNVAFLGTGSSGQRGIYLFNGSVLSRVADLKTPIPGGSGNFSEVDQPTLSGGNVAFFGFGSSGQAGMYRFNGSVLSRVADLNTPIPSGIGTFTGFFGGPPALSGSNIAFQGFGSAGQQGIYLFNGATLSRVADLNTPIPGGSGTFSLFSGFPPAPTGGNVVFLGFGSAGQSGIYLFHNGVLSRVADLNTPIPNGNGAFTGFFDVPALSTDNVAFTGFGSSGQSGIYLFHSNVLSRAADVHTPIPGGSGTFSAFSGFLPAPTGGNVAFLGFGTSGQQGIYLFNGSVLSRVADVNTPVPGGSGTFSQFYEAQLSGDNVAFLAFGSSGQQGIYLFKDSVLGRVADLNTPIPGGNGDFGEFSQPALSGGNVAFLGLGVEQQGIYLAASSIPSVPTPVVPTLSEWGMAIMMAFLAALGLWTMRRRSE